MKDSEERQRIKAYLRNPKNPDWSNNKRIAERLQTTRQTVGWVRTELERAGQIPTRKEIATVNRDGKVTRVKAKESDAKRGRPTAKSESRAYWRGWWERAAYERSIDPRELHFTAKLTRDNDRDSKREMAKMLREARKQLAHYGFNPRIIGLHASVGRIEDGVPNLDVVAESMAARYTEFFHDYQDDVEGRLLSLLIGGIPAAMSEADAYGEALDSLERRDAGGYRKAA